MDISRDVQSKQLKAFDDTKTGVKGLIDVAAGGVVDISDIFIRPPDEVAEDLELGTTSLQVPAIDLHGIGYKKSLRKQDIVKEIKQASERWGFFQVVNHGIPVKVLEDMLKAVREFNEQDVEVKRDYYSRDPDRIVKFNTNFDLYMSNKMRSGDYKFCIKTSGPMLTRFLTLLLSILEIFFRSYQMTNSRV